MILAALIEAGVPLKYLRQVVARLPFRQYTLAARKVSRGGLTATQVTLVRPTAGRNKTKKILVFDQGTSLTRPGSGYPWPKIDELLRRSRLASAVKAQSRLIFRRLAEAEAKAHGLPLPEVHFHELAGVDAIFEIVGAAAGLAYLKIEKVFSSALPLGGGRVKTAHGVLPVPAPATAGLLAAAKAPVYQDQRTGELVTPTGAAIISTLANGFGPMPEAYYDKVGCGAGRRDDKNYPNILRLFVGEAAPAGPDRTRSAESEFMLEANIDDLNPQFYYHLIDQLLGLGAYDAFVTPAYMKKRRPGVLLSALASAKVLPKIIDRVFRETTTFGLRTYPVKRYKLDRRFKLVKTKYGRVKVKLGFWQGRLINCSPEYEDCRRLAEAKNAPLREVYRQAQEIAWLNLS